MPLRRGPRRQRVVDPADVARGVRARGRARPPRSRSRTRCCRSTATARSASSPSRRRPAHHHAVGVAGLRLRGHVPRGRRRAARVSRCSSATSRSPRATRPTLPRVRARGRRAVGADAVDLLHVGHHRRPEGRTPHRRRPCDRRPTRWSTGLEITDDDVFGLVFPYTHIGGQTWTFTALMTGCRLVFIEAFVPATTIPILRGDDITLAGAGTPFHMAYLDAQRQLPEGEKLFPRVRGVPAAGRRRSRRSCTTTSSPRWAASASCRATGSPSSRSRPWRTSPTPTRSWPTPRAVPGPASR